LAVGVWNKTAARATLLCAQTNRIPKTQEAAMAKGQMRSNREKKKPKQDKNKKKGGAPAPSPFAGMHSQSNPGTNPYGKKS
jgi:hypothetical protein